MVYTFVSFANFQAPLPYRRQASKAAQLRFYETLRTEVGSEVGITILTPGYVESEITKGKGIQKTGEVAVDEDARDVLQQSSPSLSLSLIFCAHASRSLTAGLLHFTGADRGVPGGASGGALRGGAGGHPERGLVRDMAVHVPAAAADRLPRP